MERIRYIGWRPNHVDGYAKLLWPATGHEHNVPDRFAGKMLKAHPDVYQRVEADLPHESETEEAALEEAAAIKEMQETEASIMRNQINAMDKKQVFEFAQAKFGVKLPAALSVENARTRAINLVDQYGMP